MIQRSIAVTVDRNAVGKAEAYAKKFGTRFMISEPGATFSFMIYELILIQLLRRLSLRSRQKGRRQKGRRQKGRRQKGRRQNGRRQNGNRQKRS